MKTHNIYGVQLTSLQQSQFTKYITDNKITMNTKTAGERKLIVESWLGCLFYKNNS